MSSLKSKRKLADLESDYSDTSGESESNIENDESENKSESDDDSYTEEESEDKKPLVSINPKFGEVRIHERKRNGKLAQMAQKQIQQKSKSPMKKKAQNPVTQKGKVKTRQLKQIKHTIGGITVIFPGQPYPTQKEMMKSVIEGLKGGNNNLIESPTGTGKTLAMLCAILAWRRSSLKPQQSKIYYTTRTHSQISGIIKELKKTVYCEDIKTTILGSRSATCINPNRPAAVQNGKASVDSFCQTLRDNYKKQNRQKASSTKKAKTVEPKTCPYYYGTTTGEIGASDFGSHSSPMDIEDYKALGEFHQVCPYYTTMHLHQDADLVLCPYNYIISTKLRKTCSIDLEDSIIIFDEGHNLEKACCDEGSESIKAAQAIKIAQACSKALEKMEDDDIVISKDVEKSLNRFVEIFNNLAGLIKLQVKQQQKRQFHQQHEQFQKLVNPSAAIENNVVLQMLDEIGLSSNRFSILKEKLKSTVQALESFKKKYLNTDLVRKIFRILYVLEQLYSHCDDDDEFLDFKQKLKDYQLFFSKGEGQRTPTLEILCMNPSVIFQEIEEATTSITITSGTLTPLHSFSKELNSDFPKPISLDQAIPSDRYFITRVGTGPVGTNLNFKYTLRGDDDIKMDAGHALLKICKVYENGVILFAPSKAYLRELVNCWKVDGIMRKIEKYKHVFNEEDNKEKNLEERYKEKCKNPGKGTKNGALLLAYFRGTMSEGVDFKDENARAVVTIGIPHMPMSAPVACARETYYNKSDYWEWYNTDAFRAFNQGIGRCVRHLQDWGAVIMIEERLSSPTIYGTNYDKYFPKWIRDSWQDYSSFGKMIEDSKKFVRRMNGKNNDDYDETSSSEGESSSSQEEDDSLASYINNIRKKR